MLDLWQYIDLVVCFHSKLNVTTDLYASKTGMNDNTNSNFDEANLNYDPKARK